MNGFLNNSIQYFRQSALGLREVKNFRLSYIRKAFSFVGKAEMIALAILAGLAVVSLLWSGINFYLGHTVVAPAVGGIYTEGMLGQPTYINPLLAHQDTDLAITKLVYSGLYKYDSEGALVPDLAEGQPAISEDQKQYTITLRRSVKWHNDKPFTADDVVFTIQTLKDSSYKSPYRGMWLSTTVEKLSDYQVRFTTKDISGPFVQNLTLPILPKSIWSGVEPQNFVLAPQNLQAVGTGPYVIREIKKLASGKIEQVKLESFSNYYGGKPKLDTIITRFYDTDQDLINALHSKEISGFGFLSLDSNLYVDKDRSDLTVLRLPIPYYQVLFYNLHNKILGDVAVRRALSQAIDREAIVRDVFSGNALSSDSFPFSAGSVPLVYNREAAASQLDAAGWKVDPKTGLRTKKGQILELTIATNDFLLNSKAAEAVAEQWKRLNIKANLTVLTTKDLTEKHIRNRNFDVLVFPQKLDADPDPFVFWHSSQVKDPGLNLTGFANPQADKLITEARSTTDQQTREQKYGLFEALLTDQMPAVFLNQTLYLYAIDSKIKNVRLENVFDPSQRFYDTPNWYTETGRVWK